MSHNDRVTELPLRARETFTADGEVERTDSVRCPSRKAAVVVDDCMRCGYCTRAPAAGETTLGCLHPAGRDVPARRQPALHEIMTRTVICVRPELAADSLGALLLERNISAVPVVDAVGRPIGIASKTDLVRWYHEEAGYGEAADVSTLEPGMSPHEVRTTTVADLMMPLAFTLGEEAPIAYAAALMTVEGIHHLPVVSMTGEVVGIVSALDLVRWIARRDGFTVGERT